MKSLCVIILVAMFSSISIKPEHIQTTMIKFSQGELIKEVKRALTKEISKFALENLLHGLKSRNTGVQKSCIYFSGKYKIDKAVKSLAQIINSSSANENIKILAALSLYEIGSDDGMYSVYQASKFNTSKRLKRKCLVLYKNYLLNKKVKT